MCQELEPKWNTPAKSYWIWCDGFCFFFSFQLLCFRPFFSASVFSCSDFLLGFSQASSFPACTTICPRPCNQLLHCDSSDLSLGLRRPLGWKTVLHFHTFSLISLHLSHSYEWILTMTFSYSEMFRYGRRTSLICLIRNKNKKTWGNWKLCIFIKCF